MLDYRKNLAQFLLAVWLILEGLRLVFSLGFTGINFVSGGLAIAAGVCFLMGK
ncbi:MAG: hypothetical protein JNM56_23405 [Planctomycetia bacterium]|nr:hypothetical protein [Planctomycetia bacterium]